MPFTCIDFPESALLELDLSDKSFENIGFALMTRLVALVDVSQRGFRARGSRPIPKKKGPPRPKRRGSAKTR